MRALAKHSVKRTPHQRKILTPEGRETHESVAAIFAKMKVPYHGCIILLTISVILTEAFKSSAPGNNKQLTKETVQQMISRLLPGRADEFVIVIKNVRGQFVDLSEHKDSFEFHSIEGNKLQITASSGVAAAWGFNHFLKYFCKAHISWSGSQLRIPSPLPKVSKPITVTSPNR